MNIAEIFWQCFPSASQQRATARPYLNPSMLQTLRGLVNGRLVQITGRKKLASQRPELAELIPPFFGGMECVVLVDGTYAGVCRFRDEPREEGRPFIRHLKGRHRFERVLLVSGDQESEAR